METFLTVVCVGLFFVLIGVAKLAEYAFECSNHWHALWTEYYGKLSDLRFEHTKVLMENEQLKFRLGITTEHK